MRVLASAAVVLALALAGCGGEDGSSGSSAAAQTIEVHLSDFKLDPSQVSVQQPGTYTFRAINDGGTTHALELEGHGVEEETEDLQPGQSGEFTVELTEAGDYELYCPVDGHRAMGMEGSVVVGGSGASGTTTGDTGDDGSYGG